MWSWQGVSILIFYSWHRGVLLITFPTCMWGWLVGCQFNIQGFHLGKKFVPQTVVWDKFLVNIFWREKQMHDKKEGSCCVGLCFPPRAGGGVRIFGFHNNKQMNKRTIGYLLSVFNIKLYSQTKCQPDSGQKVMYVSICVCVYACVGMCRTHLANYSVGVQLSSTAAGTRLSTQYPYTGSDTWAVSQLIRAVATHSLCVGWSWLRTVGVSTLEIFGFFWPAISNFGAQNILFSEKNPTRCVSRKVGGVGWLAGLVGYFSACMSR